MLRMIPMIVITSGTLTTLHSFEMADGQNPRAGLAQATSGVFYGTTGFGGDSDDCPAGCGTIFSLDMGLAPFVETLPPYGKVGHNIGILGTNLEWATSIVQWHASDLRRGLAREPCARQDRTAGRRGDLRVRRAACAP